MNILYECIAGKAPAPALGIPILVIFVSLLVGWVLTCCEETSFNKRDALVIVIFCLGIAMGVFALQDFRYKEVYATVSEDASWKEITESYTLIEQRGELYIFRVNEGHKGDGTLL